MFLLAQRHVWGMKLMSHQVMVYGIEFVVLSHEKMTDVDKIPTMGHHPDNAQKGDT
jgi:hypothetical protein